MTGRLLAVILGLASLPASGAPNTPGPAWAEEAVWYQIFPERFRNGDPKNDPTADYCGVPEKVRGEWGVLPWTMEWYALADWEKKLAGDVYGTNGYRRYSGG